MPRDAEPQLEHKSIALELKSAGEAGEIAGYGSIFGNVDLGGDIVVRGAFEESLQERTPVMLWSHDFYAPPIGEWTSAKEDDQGLALEGKLFVEATDEVRLIHAGLKAGAISGLSIGFRSLEDDTDDAGIRRIRKAELHEVSVVNFPMNPEARVGSVKSVIAAKLGRGDLPSKREFESLLRDAGLTRQQAKAFIAEGFRGLSARDADAAELLQRMINCSKTLEA